MQIEFYRVFLPILLLWGNLSVFAQDINITGELKQWHKVTLTLDGPEACEDDSLNPFLNYRLDVSFTLEGTNQTYVVPGYFAGDGKAEDDIEENPSCGNKWRAHFAPPQTGTWSYQIRFRQGENISFSANSNAGIPIEPWHDSTGVFNIQASDKTGRDFRAHGRLIHDPNSHYLKFQGSGQAYIKIGPDSPENLLNYDDFDGVFQIKNNSPTKTWQPHIRDWEAYPGSPSWKNGKGKGLIGALNYIALEAGQNIFSFLTISLAGYNPARTRILSDDGSVHPFLGRIGDVDTTDRERHTRFDISKLAQWNIVFEHADHLGLNKQAKLFETENFNLLTENEVRLYFRELVARFGYLLGMEYNICEEIWGAAQNRFPGDDFTQRQKNMMSFLREWLPYPNVPLALHTRTGQTEYYCEYLGANSELNVASLQFDYDGIHEKTVELRKQNPQAGKWVVYSDEVGPAAWGVPPDHQIEAWGGTYPTNISQDSDFNTPSQKDIRAYALWGNLLGGGAGVQYYFGYGGYRDTQGADQTVDAFAKHSDLTVQNFRTRETMWAYNRYAYNFFMRYLPFEEMEPHDDLLGIRNPIPVVCEDGLQNDGNFSNSFYCFAKIGEVYAVGFPNGTEIETPNLQLAAGRYLIRWYNPRTGGALQIGSVFGVDIDRESLVALGDPPSDTSSDWIALIQKDTNNTPFPPSPPVDPSGCAPLPEPWQLQDVGGASDSRACFENGQFNFSTGEGKLSDNQDTFTFISQTIDSDSIEIITQIKEISDNAEAGIMIREDNNPDAKFALLKFQKLDNFIVQHISRKQIREQSQEIQIRGVERIPLYLRLVRLGNSSNATVPTEYIFRAYISETLGNWTELGSSTILMNRQALVGLTLLAKDDNVNASSEFAQTRINIANGVVTSLNDPLITLLNNAVIYPNVTQSQLNLRFSELIPQLKYSLTDTYGKVHLEGSQLAINPGTAFSLNLSSLSSGMYFLRVNIGESKTRIWKIMKE